MEEFQSTQIPGAKPPVDKTIDLRKLLGKCKRYWYWFLISVVVCTGFGYVQYKTSIPQYSRQTQLQVVGMDDSNSLTETLSNMDGLFSTTPQSQTELIAMTTPAIMMEVTKRLNLNMHYSTPGKWYVRSLYGAELPVNVSFVGVDQNGSATMTGAILPGGKIRIDTYSHTTLVEGVTKTADVNKIVSYIKGVEVKTPIGDISITPNPLYSGVALNEPMDITVSQSGLYNTARGLSSAINGVIHEESDEIIILTLTDSNPQRAEDILNTVVSVYNESVVRERAEAAEATTRFINDRLNVVESELGSVESDISSFKSANMVPDVTAASSIYLQQASTAGNRVRELSTQLAMTRYVRDYIAQAANSNNILPSNTGLGDLGIEGQIAEYNRTLMERNQLVANSSPSNPLVADMDTRLAGYRHALVQSLDNAIQGLNTAISGVQRSEDISAGKVASTPGQARYLLSVERQQKVKESLYLFLLQKREENELSQSFVGNRIHVISKPDGSPSPISPKRNQILLIAFLIGILIPLGVIIIHDTIDNKVRDKKDLQRLTVPFLGEIPKNPHVYGLRTRRRLKRSTGEDSQGIVVEKDNLDMINEAFRVLRTNMEIYAHHDSENGAAVIAVTSANPGSGKTYLTMNLCAALAVKGRRVLMIDMDLRRASLSNILSPHRGTPGLVNYIVSPSSYGNDVSSLICHNINDIEGLDLLCAGTMPPNPSELLTEPSVAALMADLRSRYDFIFLDCPPIDIVADALIINPLADMTLFVVRAGVASLSVLNKVQEMYNNKTYRNLSIILNGAPARDSGYGYGNNYYYRKRGYKNKKK